MDLRWLYLYECIIFVLFSIICCVMLMSDIECCLRNLILLENNDALFYKVQTAISNQIYRLLVFMSRCD